jgi:hypothetical protein
VTWVIIVLMFYADGTHVEKRIDGSDFPTYDECMIQVGEDMANQSRVDTLIADSIEWCEMSGSSE